MRSHSAVGRVSVQASIASSSSNQVLLRAVPVAKRTGGTYHGAEDAGQLREVFAELPRDVATQQERSEITWIFAAVAGLLAGAAIAASMRWSAYP